MLPQPPSFSNSLLLYSCKVFCPIVLLLIMSAPCNPHHLGQINNEECNGFDSWREANLELRQLRVQLKSIPKDHPQHLLLYSWIQLLSLKKNQYMDPTSPTSPIRHPDPVMKKSLAIQEPAMCSSPKGSNPAKYSSILESDYHNIVSHFTWCWWWINIGTTGPLCEWVIIRLERKIDVPMSCYI